MNVPLLVIVCYLVFVTFVGSLSLRHTRSSRDWSVAGGSLTAVMVAAGVAGTRIGGAGTYGVAGNVMNGSAGGGLWNMWWYSIGTFLALVLVGTFFAIPYRRLHLQTIGEIFSIRFGRQRCQVLTSLCVQTEYAIVNVIEVYVIGIILVGVMGMPMALAVTIAAVVLVSYISLGGLWGSATTNLIHCATILGGLSIVGWMGIGHLGGWSVVRESIHTHLAGGSSNEAAWWSFMGASGFAVFGMIFSTAIHTPAASVYTNYATSARNEKILLPAFLIAGVVAAAMPLLAGLIGIEALAKYGLDSGLSGYKNITTLPMLISPWIGGLALAAILAAVISSGGPILLSSSTMFVRDWLPGSRKASPQQTLLAYRLTTIIYGAIAALLAYLWSIADAPISILDILLFGFAMVVPPAIAVVYLIYWKRTTEPGAFWGMVAGYVGGLIWWLAIRWAEHSGLEVGEGASTGKQLLYTLFADFRGTGLGLDPSYLTTLIPLGVVPMVSILTQEHAEGKERFYAVVSGEQSLNRRNGE